MAPNSRWEQNVAEGANALLSYSQEELLAILKRTLPERLEVLQDLVDWAVPGYVYGSARGLLDARYAGTVKSISEKNGYGFITDPSITEAFGADMFVHARQLRGLGPGTPVNFAILLNKGKPHAYDVMLNEEDHSSIESWQPPARQPPTPPAPAPPWGRKGDDRGKGSIQASSAPDWSPAGAHTRGNVGAKGAWTGEAAGRGSPACGKVSAGKGSPSGGKSSLGSSPAGGWHQGGAADSTQWHQADSGKQAGSSKGSGTSQGSGYAYSGEVPTSAVEMPGVTDRRFQGFVKSFKVDKFGFVTSEGLQRTHSDQDIYVHWNHVKEFQVGDAVTFAVLLNEKGGLKAVDLKPEKRGVGAYTGKRARTQY